MLRGLVELADLVFPRECAVCGRDLAVDERHICAKCLKDMPLTYFWHWKDNPAEKHLWVRTRFERVVSLFFYSKDNQYSELLHKIKYQGNLPLGVFLGWLLGDRLRGAGFTADAIVPVPLHWYRKFRRGYNQSEIIARGLSEALGGIPVRTKALIRRKYSSSQTDKSMEEKWNNVSGSFALGHASEVRKLAGRHIFLVDDVLTSGATAEACWNALKDIPGLRITYVTVACVKL